MKTKKSQILVILLAVTILVSLLGSGCSLVNVDPEKDKQQTVAEVDGNKILKEEFNNYMAYYQMYFDSNGQTLPTGKEFVQLKKDVLDDLVRVETMTAQGKKDGVTVDEAALGTEAATMITNLKTTMVGEDKYNSTLATYNTDAASFEAFMTKFIVNNEVANTVSTNYDTALRADPSKELNTVVGKIDGEDIKKDLYNYRLANEELLTYYQTQKPLATDAATVKTTNQTIFNTIAQQKAMIKYAEDNKLTVPQEAIDSNVASQTAFVNTLIPGDEALQKYLDQKYLTVAKFREFQQQDAKAAAANTVIQSELASKVTVSDGDVKKYYEDNKQSYDTSTVSAKHILATDETLAKQIYEEAKNVKTTEEFDALIAKYKTVDGVKEATDLGAFTSGKMVPEFSAAAFALEKGGVSEPVKTDYGYHIIYVYDKTQGQIPSLEDKKTEVTEAAKSEKAAADYSKFTADLLKKQKIEMNDIVTPLATYITQLKKDLNVKVYENRIN
ncbi:SurA N-terminal domain-containing protein [Acetobacterium sp.]|uniref:SurA N-terminal domain-containing protein n=1 Tax=Acetobacterium sp. TaxID=1872094 RepID=UPI002F40327F